MSLNVQKLQRSEIKNKNKKKREFSLEKIATAIHCEHLISSLRNKYSDPLFTHKNNKFPKKTIKQYKILKPNPFSFKTKLFQNIPKEQQQQTEEEKAIQTKNNNLCNPQFPIIIPNKILQQINSARNINEYKTKKNPDRFLITSGMFSQREYWKNPPQKVKLGIIMNLKYDNNNENEEEIYYPKIKNINKVNEKYNLHLNLKHLIPKNKTIDKPRRMSKRSLMSFLFKKYAYNLSGENTKNNIDNINNKIKKKYKGKKNSVVSIISRNGRNFTNDIEFLKTNSRNSIDSDNVSVEFIKKYFSEDNDTFITKTNISKDENKNTKDSKDTKNTKDKSGGTITDIINKKNVKIKNLKIYEKNNNIINHDKKITIDCLYSNVNSNIEQNKLIYNNKIEKTTFQLQKESSYKKVKHFESIIDKIMKTQD